MSDFWAQIAPSTMTAFTTTYAQVKQYKPDNLRAVARNMALNGLSLKTKLPGASKLLSKPRVQFLYIHHVFKDELDNFDKLLERLSKHHTFISYSEAVERVRTGNIDKAYISISSDDGFKNNLDAANVMAKYGASACFFVNPDTIGLKDPEKIAEFCKRQLNFPPTGRLSSIKIPVFCRMLR